MPASIQSLTHVITHSGHLFKITAMVIAVLSGFGPDESSSNNEDAMVADPVDIKTLITP